MSQSKIKDCLIDIVIDFDQTLMKEKKRQKRYEFSDIAHAAFNILYDVKEKKPTKNTAAVKAAVKQKKKELNLHRCKHKKGKGKVFAKQQRKISLSERKKLRKATVIQLNTKKSSTASKKASTPIKKAA